MPSLVSSWPLITSLIATGASLTAPIVILTVAWLLRNRPSLTWYLKLAAPLKLASGTKTNLPARMSAVVTNWLAETLMPFNCNLPLVAKLETLIPAKVDPLSESLIGPVPSLPNKLVGVMVRGVSSSVLRLSLTATGAWEPGNTGAALSVPVKPALSVATNTIWGKFELGLLIR